MSKVLINYDQLCGLADHARRVGTLDALADVALQWAGQADKEMERLTAERDELRRQLAEAEMDAERYQWLRNEANTARKCDPMVCIYPLDDQDLIEGDRLDVAIDAAMGASNE